MPLFWLSIAFLSGILLADIISASWLLWSSLGALCILAVFLFRRLRPSLWPARPILFLTLSPLVLAAALFLGSARYAASQFVLSPSSLSAYNDLSGKVVVTGAVLSQPKQTDCCTRLKVRVDWLSPADPEKPGSLPPEGRKVDGLVVVSAAYDPSIAYGDRVRVTGRLSTPSEDEEFSYKAYLARKGVFSVISYAVVQVVQTGGGNPLLAGIYRFQQAALAVVDRLYQPPESSFMAGVLLGDVSTMPQTLVETFQKTGTAHILAVSGFNMTIVAGMFSLLFTRLLGRRKGALVALLGIVLYTLLTGASASVLRAAIMGGLALLAGQLGRRQNGFNTLAFTATLMALLDPNVLWDVGFQLSFSATLGLVVYGDRFVQAFQVFLQRWLPANTAQRATALAGDYVLLTLAAQVTSLPVILFHYQRFSLVSFMANPLALPPQPAIMTLGGLSALLGMIWLPLGQPVAILVQPLVTYTLKVLEGLSALPGGQWILPPVPLVLVGLYYLLLLGFTYGRVRIPKLGELIPASTLLFGSGVVAVLTWQMVLARPDGNLHLTVLDAGSSEALLIQSPGGQRLLIGGGASASRLSSDMGKRLPPFDTRLDALVVCSTQPDDILALSRVLERYRPQLALWAGENDSQPPSRDLASTLAGLSIPITAPQAGQVLALDSDGRLTILAVDEQGMLLLLEWVNFRAVLPCGAGPADLVNLRGRLGTLPPLGALLLAGHGEVTVNSPEIIAELEPVAILLSVAAGNRSGQPSPELIQALQGYTLLRTDHNGWIELITDGEQMWAEVERR